MIGDRGELRDYFDLMVIEQQTAITVKSALLDYQVRYRPSDPGNLVHLVRALGYLGDVADDPALPVKRQQIEDYWHARQPRLFTALDPTGAVQGNRPPPAPSDATDEARPSPGASQDSDAYPRAETVWVAPHTRNGGPVRGDWRRR